jgi:MOSC domain-containing protein YiiM
MGSVQAIFITPTNGTPLNSVDSVQAVPGKGPVGDRNFFPEGSPTQEFDRQITLIEAEAIEAARRDYAIDIDASQCRRNLLTRGVALNHLVGRDFHVGEVRLRGTMLCEPCGHLEKLTKKGIRKALVHRGGLCAQILSQGQIRVGDQVVARPAGE